MIDQSNKSWTKFAQSEFGPKPAPGICGQGVMCPPLSHLSDESDIKQPLAQICPSHFSWGTISQFDNHIVQIFLWLCKNIFTAANIFANHYHTFLLARTFASKKMCKYSSITTTLPTVSRLFVANASKSGMSEQASVWQGVKLYLCQPIVLSLFRPFRQRVSGVVDPNPKLSALALPTDLLAGPCALLENGFYSILKNRFGLDTVDKHKWIGEPDY